MEIKLSRRTFEALVSETRIEILRKLDRRPMTVSELARELGIAKSAVHEHLAKLVEAGLAERVAGERKWVYYRLTPQAVALLHPESKYRLLVLLGTGLLALTGGIALVLRSLYRGAAPAQPTSYMAAGYSEIVPKAANLSTAPVQASPARELTLQAGTQSIAGAALLLLGMLLLLLWYRKRRALQKRYIR